MTAAYFTSLFVLICRTEASEYINLSSTFASAAYVLEIGTSQCRYETLSLGIQCLCDVNASKWPFMGKLERKTLCWLLSFTFVFSSCCSIACGVRFVFLSCSVMCHILGIGFLVDERKTKRNTLLSLSPRQQERLYLLVLFPILSTFILPDTRQSKLR